jgi:hypothetical protein
VAALALGLAFPVLAAADSGPDAAWVMLTSLPERLDGPVFALAADPTNPQVVLAGTSRGTIYRSGDAGLPWLSTPSSPARCWPAPAVPASGEAATAE